MDKPMKWYPDFCKTLPDLKGKVIAITGTTTGTGNVAAKTCAQKGATVILLNRTSERSEKSLQVLKQEVPEGEFVPIPCDLMDLNSVKQAAAEIKRLYSEAGLDVLCCNAGIMAMPDEATKDGFDVQMQTNHLSHWVLTAELFPLLKAAGDRTGDARVVYHSSGVRKQVNKLEAKYFGKNGGSLGGNSTSFTGARWRRYNMTKLANAVCGYALADRLRASGVTSVKSIIAEPGLAATNLQVTTNAAGGMSPFLIGLFFGATGQHMADGAMPLLAACCLPDAASGDFYVPKSTTVGPPVKLTKPDKMCVSEDNKKMVLEESAKALGVDVVVAPTSG
eukprot:CAMPEP_0174926602 /NCGR_PEP_ID=MMETSP1355-20121228/12535_1 /TAXON_ID=464990 /ORGANISM="Hemiselmis tepida, Strain CCMP443" /LENGTH=334 /DNA_ID=CAMNT_0016172645 /DNA_START=57 /DNA_END=1061 /DNA_ORIENTATION=+